MQESSSSKPGPREVFLHLLSIIALYVSVGAALTILFQVVNTVFPDALSYPYGRRAASGAARGAIATLIVAFPLYVWAHWFMERRMAAAPAVREMKIRRWLVYFTLFLAGLVIAGDLVALIWNFLGGEITTRFVLKVLAVLAVTALVFIYYLWNERKPGRDARKRAFAWVAIALVALVLVGGFFVTGSPVRERMRRFDERRVSDLQSIQFHIVDYWQSKEVLPENLEILEDDLRGIRIPEDPETEAPYGYEVTGERSFALCATFNLESEDEGERNEYRYGTVERTWEHGEGYICFERTIDPDFYKQSRDLPRPTGF